MSDLMAFLTARIDERETAALAASEERFQHAIEDGYLPDGYPSPARVLAECEAKRRIIEWHKSWPVLVETPPELVSALDDPTRLSVRMTQRIAWVTQQEYVQRFGEEPPSAPILRMLAQVYREHPDFDPAWAL